MHDCTIRFSITSYNEQYCGIVVFITINVIIVSYIAMDILQSQEVQNRPNGK